MPGGPISERKILTHEINEMRKRCDFGVGNFRLIFVYKGAKQVKLNFYNNLPYISWPTIARWYNQFQNYGMLPIDIIELRGQRIKIRKMVTGLNPRNC